MHMITLALQVWSLGCTSLVEANELHIHTARHMKKSYARCAGLLQVCIRAHDPGIGAAVHKIYESKGYQFGHCW